MAARLAITQVEGWVSKGELTSLSLEIESEGISFVLLSLQGKKKKPNLIREIPPKTNRILLDREVVDAAQCLCGEDLTIRIFCLADASIADQWTGKLVCREIEERPAAEEERKGQEAAEPFKTEEGEISALEEGTEDIPVPDRNRWEHAESYEPPTETVREKEEKAVSEGDGVPEKVATTIAGPWGPAGGEGISPVVEEGAEEVLAPETPHQAVAKEEEKLQESAMADSHLELTEVKCFAQKGEVAEILVEGNARGCKSIFLKVEWGKVKSFQVLFPSQGGFKASFDRRLFPPTPVDEVDAISVTAFSLSDSKVSDSWQARPQWLEKKEEVSAAGEVQQREERGSLGEGFLERITSMETPSGSRGGKKKEMVHEVGSPSVLPVVVISEVMGIVSQGRVREVAVEGSAKGCEGLFIRLQLEGVKFFQRVKVKDGSFHASFDHEMIQNRPRDGFEDILITAVSLTQPAVSDIWRGKITWLEEERGQDG